MDEKIKRALASLERWEKKSTKRKEASQTKSARDYYIGQEVAFEQAIDIFKLYLVDE